MEKALKIKLFMGTIFVCIFLTALAITLVQKYTPSETMRTLDNYYDVAFDEAVVILENEIFEERALLKDGGVYLLYSTILDMVDMAYYLDKEEQLLSYALPEALICVEEGKDYYYNNEDIYEIGCPIFFLLEDKYYISLEFVSMFSNIEYQYYENPNRVVLQHQWTDFLYYDTVGEETPIRFEPSIKSDILRLVKAGERLYYIGGTGSSSRSFLKVMTEDGIFGYVQKKFLGESYYLAKQSSYEEPIYTYTELGEKVRLGWHQVTVEKANDNLEQVVKNASEMNVISPTWYRLIDTQGNISSIASASYVQKAHEMGLQVWALIDNFASDVSTYEVLSSSKARATLIENMMKEAKAYGFDGWNIDFESLTAQTGVHYIQFLKELSIQCRKEGFVLSVDNHVPAPYNEFYDLKTQGKVVDYVIIMAYDEHYAGSKTAGSVSSMSFFKKAVKDTLDKMPKERIVIGVPFYTRLWAEQVVDGAVKVSSEALTMDKAKNVLTSRSITAEWKEEVGQYYAQYEEDEITYKIWLEEETSMHKRLEIISGAEVAGIATWRLGQEAEGIWPMIEQYVK